MSKDVILFSGGMDCLIGWYYVDKPKAVYFNLNHRYKWKELESIKKLRMLNPEIIIETNEMFDLAKYEHEDAHIPFRNRLLVMGAAMAYPEAEKIYLVAQKGEQSIPDRSPEFFEDMSALVSKEMERKIEIVNPFPHMTKVTMVEWFMKRVKREDLLKASVGCFDGGSVMHCGACGSCFRRSVAFAANGLELDSMWSDITKWKGIPEYIKNMQAGKYELERTEQTLKVLRDWGYEV